MKEGDKMIYEGKPKVPKSELTIIEWKNNLETFPIILRELNKYPWCEIDHINIYRWWKKDSLEKELKELGDVAYLETNILLPLLPEDNDATITLYTKKYNTINIGPYEAQLHDCFVIDKKAREFYYGDIEDLKERYDIEERKDESKCN